MTPIKIFYHVVDLPGWETIATEQLTRMHDSGLLDTATLHANLHYNPKSFNNFKTTWNHPNIIWHDSPHGQEEWELPTLIMMQQAAINSQEDFYALHMHLKGVTHIGKPYENYGRDWRRYMDWFNVVNWRHMVAKLDEGYDSAGVNRQGGPPSTITGETGQHYSGTCYWVTSKFLKTCKPVLKLPSEVGYQCQYPHPTDNVPGGHRYDVEFYTGWNNDNGYSFMHSNRHHYLENFPEEHYINFFNK